MSGYACPTCKRFFRVKKVGVFWEEGMPATNDLTGLWQSYKLWAGDLLECEGCGAQLIIPPPARRPLAEHYQPEYPQLLERYAPIVRIDDCPGGPFSQERADELRTRLKSNPAILREALDRATARAEKICSLAHDIASAGDAIVCMENDTRHDHGFPPIDDE